MFINLHRQHYTSSAIITSLTIGTTAEVALSHHYHLTITSLYKFCHIIIASLYQVCQIKSLLSHYYTSSITSLLHSSRYCTSISTLLSHYCTCTSAGGSLVVNPWSLDQKIVYSNPTHGRNTFMSCARSLGLLSQFGKMSTSFRWPWSST